jgi:cytochrome c oxidase subunit 2
VRRGNRTIIEMIVVGVIASAVGIAIALAIDWFPPAASKQAGPIDTLWDVLLIVSVPIFVLVSVVVLFSVREFRMRPGQELDDGAPIHGNTRLEVVWTAVPAVIIASLVVYAYLVLRDIEKAPANASTEMRVKVTGEQFAWKFDYPQAGGKTISSNALYVPQGRSVKFDIVAKDVLHDFWVPAWRMKIDAVPGITTHYRITPTKLGRYPVVCAELCGLGHAFMRATATVLTPSRFDAWLKKQGAPAPTSTKTGGNSTAAKPDGKALFASTALACTSCHTLADAKSTGTTGPDLDKALATASVDDIRQDIASPNASIESGYQPGIMPQDYAKRLSPAELTALATYLQKVTAK